MNFISALIEVVPVYAKMRDIPSRGRVHFREAIEEVGRESFERKNQYTNPSGRGQVTERIRVNVIDGPGEDIGTDLRVPLRHKRLYFKRLDRRRRDHKSRPRDRINW